MSAAARYAYLHTRVSLFVPRLLDEDQLNHWIEQDAKVDAALFEHAAITTLGASDLNTTAIEQCLVDVLINETAILTRPLAGQARGLLAYWAHRLELSNLKTIIRGKMTGQAPALIREQLVDMGVFTTLPVDHLLQSEDIGELLRRLEQTPYVDIARQGRRMLEHQRDPFALDAALDRRYFAGLVTRADATDPVHNYTLRRLVGSIVDRVNLVWLLRYRVAYDLPPSQAYYLLIPAGDRLTSSRLLTLAQMGSQAEVLNALPPPFDTILRGAQSTLEVTLRLERQTWKVAAAIVHRSAFNLARALAYLVLRERDLRRIRAIFRGKRLNMSEPLIRNATGLHSSTEPPAELH
jgi:V/A-type H+-transporting ATPase subunit C